MNQARSAPTLEDVAQAAGVSTATVSRTLNTPDRVVAKTRTRVMAVIEQLGYTPNFAARVMAAKRTFTIGAIIPTMENAIFARGIQAFQEELRKRGYTLLVSSFLYQPDVEKEQIRTLVARGADGILLIGHERDPEIYRYLEHQNVPALVTWSYNKDASRPSVGFENRLSMKAMTQEVIKLGHVKIAMITGAKAGNDRVRQRIEGTMSVMQESGIDPETLTVIETSHEIEKGGDAFDELMNLPQPPTAIICGNDVLAVGAIRRARDRGIDIPGEVSITGFDDIELARIVSPTLTTVHVPHRDMGRKAAETLIEMVEKKEVGRSICLETTLEIRETLGPAKA